MTYPDDPNLQRPVYPRGDEGIGAGAWIGGLFALLIIVSVIVWATGVGRDAQVAGSSPPTAVTTSPSATTGTGGTGTITPPAPDVAPPAQPR